MAEPPREATKQACAQAAAKPSLASARHRLPLREGAHYGVHGPCAGSGRRSAGLVRHQSPSSWGGRRGSGDGFSSEGLTRPLPASTVRAKCEIWGSLGFFASGKYPHAEANGGRGRARALTHPKVPNAGIARRAPMRVRSHARSGWVPSSLSAGSRSPIPCGYCMYNKIWGCDQPRA